MPVTKCHMVELTKEVTNGLLPTWGITYVVVEGSLVQVFEGLPESFKEPSIARSAVIRSYYKCFFSRPLPPMGDLWGYLGSRIAGVVARTAMCRLQPDSE